MTMFRINFRLLTGVRNPRTQLAVKANQSAMRRVRTKRQTAREKDAPLGPLFLSSSCQSISNLIKKFHD